MWSESVTSPNTKATAYSGSLECASTALEQGKQLNHWRSAKRIFSAFVKLCVFQLCVWINLQSTLYFLGFFWQKEYRIMHTSLDKNEYLNAEQTKKRLVYISFEAM